MRIYFSAWGRGQWNEPSYAVNRDPHGHFRGQAVARAIARKSGLDIVTLRPDGTTDEQPQYHLTLGRPLSTGGWSPEAEIWFVVKEVRQ